jgi:uncharacterized protein (TIGR03435 family)
MLRAVFGFVFSIAALGQSALGQTFDVASIKPAVPPAAGGMRRFGASGGPGTKDPSLFTCTNCTVSMLVTQAYDLKRYQLSAPASLDEDRFNITAPVPDGATKEQFRLMLQNLLAERFKPTVHHEKKEMPVFDLIVAKNGPKLKEAAPIAASDVPPAPPPLPYGPGRALGPAMERDKDGFPIFPTRPGPNLSMSMMPGKARLQAGSQSMDQLAAMLTNQLGKPVTDATGLKAKYDFTLTFASDGMAMGFNGIPPPPPPPGGGSFAPPAAPSEASDPMPDIFGAVQQQLGLKLDPKKGMIDVLVVDHAEKTPTEN